MLTEGTQLRAFFLYIAFLISLPRREFALSVLARINTHATVSPNYLLGVCAFGAYVDMLTEGMQPHAFFLYIAFLISLPRREFALSVLARINTHATVSPNYLLGVCAFGAYVDMLTEGTQPRAFFLYIAFLI